MSNNWYQNKHFPQSRVWAKHRCHSNRSENLTILSQLDKVFIQNRHYVFKMPKPKQPVIAFMSGGLDTTVVIELLMAKFRVTVYPLYINRRTFNSKPTWLAVQKLSDYFHNKYPTLFHSPMKVDCEIPPKELRYKTRLKHGRLVFSESHFGTGNNLGWERRIDQQGHLQGVPMQPTIYSAIGMHYSKYIYEKFGYEVKTSIGSCLPSNSDYYQYETLTAHRAVMFNLCLQYNDFSWQYTSLPMETELGYYFDKDKIVRLGAKYHVPMEDTFTCWKNQAIQCGVCPLCLLRKDAFAHAKIIDKTKYTNK